MIGRLSRRERLLVAVALLVASLIVSWNLVAQRIVEHNRAAAALLPAREQLLQRRQSLVARNPEIFRDLEATTARLDALSARFLTAATPAVAASELQTIFKEMATQATTDIRSERILPPVERGALLEIPIEVAVASEIRQLVDLLARLELTPKLLIVQSLKVRVVNVSQPKELLTTLTLSGFIVPGKAKT